MSSKQTSPQASGRKPGRPKSAAKCKQIIDAAACLFLQSGLSGTTMDQVANRAGVSKQTLYSHFSNKEMLFQAVIHGKLAQYQLDDPHEQQQDLCFEDIMRRLAYQFIELLLDEDVIAMHRVVIGEVQQSPQVAALFFQAGPEQSAKMVGQIMQKQPDFQLSEQEAMWLTLAFLNLLKGDYHLRSLLGLEFSMSKQKKEHLVDFAVKNLMHMLKPYLRAQQ
ncbi:TetR/AcrR family transcriptional regulator [Aliiglaciecola sp. CAU 1673]|uniref:TetR/AcrR family transcriptional regulator n=1 Tax=Aliiglaciecola sp. CAU 1673 TaxID=3032595 RepID=UPI0023D9D3FE|nr:TetR/AcrR family transcriptional regulator [Aliiglaciecola sp. CAU 1673]MDF2176660.1 TetR/AcrR family transcriptional regulator [Aliiglaciecola sp. CAU 1673]